jgi:tetratricopeptide (TPR) repeat protein
MDDRRLQLVLAFSFGVVFVIVLLVLTVAIPNPTATTFFVFRVVLALAAAGVGAILPGLLVIHVSKGIRAGGALALFVLVYVVNPAPLLVTADADLVERGEIALAKADPVLAASLFKDALAYNPSNWRAHYGIGRVHFARQDYSASAAAFERAIQLSEDGDWVLYRAQSMAREAQKDLDGARASLLLALRSAKPESDVIQELEYDRARLLLLSWLETGDPASTPVYTEGLAVFEKFIERGGYPKHWALYHIACFRATAATDLRRTTAERIQLQGAAVSDLKQALALLETFNSARANSQQSLMISLLSEQGKYNVRPGDPVRCNALAALWASSRS